MGLPLLNLSLSQGGQVQVGDTPGLHIVTARAGDAEAQAQIRAVAAKQPVGPAVKSGDDDSGKRGEKNVIRWNGTIPAQTWTEFDMKVVCPFAHASGRSRRVEVEERAAENEQAHPGFRGATSSSINDPSRALPRLRTLCTNWKNPRYNGSRSCEIP